MSEAVIKFNNFSFKYNAQQQPTLKNINLEIHAGEKVLIAGPSGCGKSTLAHCINGLIPFSYKGETEGSLTVNGRETRELGIFELSATVGTVLQDSDGQFVGLTVAEDIAFALENSCVAGQELYKKVRKAAEMVNISGHLASAPGELSGGQKQRVSLAGVLVDNVEVLLFDEPLANLDPATGRQAIELIDEIQKKTGAAVIIIEHRLEDVLWRSVDRIVLLREGRIIADDAPDVLLSGHLLEESGVREPLYLSALRYAGVEITPDIHPACIRTLTLPETAREKVRAWYEDVPEAPEKEQRPLLLLAENIEFAYGSGRKALNGITLSIERGEMTAIVGTNGAGKSTFSKVLCGFETPQTGRLMFGGQDMSALSIKERADRIGYVMQNPNEMISKVQIFDEVALGLETRGVRQEEITARVEEALRICGLWPFRNWPVSALSYGQKKRVTIASILALKPELIILDEPTAGQDYRHYTEIMEFLLELNRKGMTVLMITHDMHLMLEYAERAVVFEGGKIIADSTGAAVLTDKETVSRASLKETSLYDLAGLCGIEDGQNFVSRFIAYERENRR